MCRLTGGCATLHQSYNASPKLYPIATNACAIHTAIMTNALEALEQRGWHLIDRGETLRHPALTCDAAAAGWSTGLGPQDLIIASVKGHSLLEVAPHIAALSHPDTV